MILAFSMMMSALPLSAKASIGSTTLALAKAPPNAVAPATKWRRVSDAAENPKGFPLQSTHMVTPPVDVDFVDSVRNNAAHRQFCDIAGHIRK